MARRARWQFCVARVRLPFTACNRGFQALEPIPRSRSISLNLVDHRVAAPHLTFMNPATVKKHAPTVPTAANE
jgi:hypothetical protein